MCNGKKKKEKKETVFLFGGLFGKTAALPTAASLQRALKGCSPLLSLSPPISPNELLPLVLGSNSPASPRPPSPDHTAAELWSGLHSGSWETFSQGALNPLAHTSSKHSAPGSSTFRHFWRVSLPPPCNAATWLPSSVNAEDCVCRRLWAVPSHTT